MCKVSSPFFSEIINIQLYIYIVHCPVEPFLHFASSTALPPRSRPEPQPLNDGRPDKPLRTRLSILHNHSNKCNLIQRAIDADDRCGPSPIPHFQNILQTFFSRHLHILEMDIWEKFQADSNPGPQDHQLTTRPRPQPPNRWKIFGIYSVTY